MNKRRWSHYDWLNEHFEEFLEALGGDWRTCGGIISAHGDKCYSYRDIWYAAGIPFSHGVAIYLLSYIAPWYKEVRDTDNGWVDPFQWVIDSYPKFKKYLTTLDLNKVDV